MPLRFGKLVLCLLVAGPMAALVAILLYPPLNPFTLLSMLDWNLIATEGPSVHLCGSLPLPDESRSLGWNSVLFCATLPSTEDPLRTDSFAAHSRDTILAKLGSVEPNWRWKVSSSSERLRDMRHGGLSPGLSAFTQKRSCDDLSHAANRAKPSPSTLTMQ